MEEFPLAASHDVKSSTAAYWRQYWPASTNEILAGRSVNKAERASVFGLCATPKASERARLLRCRLAS